MPQENRLAQSPSPLPPLDHSQPNPSETSVEFPENRLLIDLCGVGDAHLVQIESHLGVQIFRRGNHLTLMGDPDVRERAAEVLTALYGRLEAGRDVGPADIDAEIRMGGATADEGAGASAQMEMFQGGKIEIRTRKKLVEPRTDAQKAYVAALFQNELAFGIGPAGTGKTYLAVAVGVNLFINGDVDRIILCRPAVEAGERLGFLPGTQEEKVDPYMQPLYDALNDFLPSKQVAKLIEEKRIEIAPLAFMRGRTLADAFIILDEAQNTTIPQMKMFLTRFGMNSRMVICGDPKQVDLPVPATSGLADAVARLEGLEGINVSRFTSADVVRHPIVGRIVEAYEGPGS